MAHHQGMSLLSIAYFLLNKPMQKRFEAEPQFQASLLLLQERIPKSIKFFTPPPDVADMGGPSEDSVLRVLKGHDGQVPEIQLISNGNYHVMVTGSGSGYSRYKNIALTRWHEDTTRENWGSFCYIRDVEKGDFYSTGYQPTLVDTPSYEAVFSQGRAEFKRQDLDLETHTEMVVSPEDDVEIRRVKITNRSRKTRILELTSYAEVVMASAISDDLHPAFSNLFVETEILESKNAILCTRRPRTEEEKNIWFFHLLKAGTPKIQKISFETDRLQFIGRTRNLEKPRVMLHDQGLSGTQGPVLDPIVSIQYQVKIDPQQTISFDLIYGVGENRTQAENLINKYQDTSFIERSFELAWTHNQVILRQINATESDAQLYEKLAGSIIFSNSLLRADPSIILTNQRGQSGLWGYSISGDLPIVLLRISDQENIKLVKEMIQAHAYWRLKGLIVDLVIWNEEHSDYRQVLQNQIIALTSDGMDKEAIEKPGGIFVRVVEQISAEDRILIQTVARVEISDLKGTLSYQTNKKNVFKNTIPNIIPNQSLISETLVNLPSPPVLEGNGLGGFSLDGREYIVNLGPGKITPMPWVNVIANPEFGTVISESGQAYTWAVNAHEFRLSPWENDPVSDGSGEAFYLRDEENGNYWSPSPLPCKSESNYIVHHGYGYSSFEHIEDGIYSEMKQYVDLEESIKFIVIRIKNQSGRSRRLTATGYIEWVLGDLRSKNSMFVVTEIDEETGGLIARNLYNKEFNDQRVSFFDINDSSRTFTGDRTEFIGRNRSLANPDAMDKIRLSRKVGAALDPCGALQSMFYLGDQEEHEVLFLLGTTHNIDLARVLLPKMKARGAAADALAKVVRFWDNSLNPIQLETSNPGINFMTNGWLLYQTLACRFWARSGFYQSGGAFGFRDQLQDSMALVAIKPDLTRKHLLLCASRQFKEGDVQHWWHPPSGRGVRTRCSDDFLWLAFVTCRYVRYTQDFEILHEPVSFIEGRLLNHGEESYYDQVNISSLKTPLYDHCKRAIRNGLKLGVHDLPLMGTGDWNDGMDRVGNEGKGESVWLAFFLISILKDFSLLSLQEKDEEFSNYCLSESKKLKTNIEEYAWDGEWYIRAFYDDGTPLGSKQNVDCQIDSLTQSWSVLSDSGNHERSIQGMNSVYSQLVNKDLHLIQLLNPPFDKGPKNPGYIKGYVPGIRENGGQYTHAAIWMVMAFAKMKNKEMAWELFSMVHPVNHGNSPGKMELYKVEPYVIAADIYKDQLHPGRGGWTWYTGSAGWMYRLLTESLLGLIREGDYLIIDPCLSTQWGNFRILYQFKDTSYELNYVLLGHEEKTLEYFKANPEHPVLLKLNGALLESTKIQLLDDKVLHSLDILIAP
jgi:cellobiose phosphorylase